MRRALCLLVVLATTACASAGTSPQANVPSPSPGSLPPTPTGGPVTPGDHVTPSPTAGYALTCSLPYITTDPNQWGKYLAVGFLTLPDGTFAADPAAISNLPANDTPFSIPGYGGHPWWDAMAKRWVPVPLFEISPDGQRYVYFSTDGLHLVSLTGSADHVIYRRPTGVQGGQVLAFWSDGVYIDIPSAVKAGEGGSYSNPPDQVGIWRVDTTTGASVRILQNDVGGSLAAGGLWSVRSPDTGDVLVRTDLTSGQQTDWFSDPGRRMQFLGVDHLGLPIVWTFANGHLEIWRVVAPNTADDFHTVDYGGEPPIYPPEITEGDLIGDGYGVWLGAPDGLYLYGVTGFSKVAATAGIPAGPCM
jgi:hypothetical protein